MAYCHMSAALEVPADSTWMTSCVTTVVPFGTPGRQSGVRFPGGDNLKSRNARRTQHFVMVVLMS